MLEQEYNESALSEKRVMKVINKSKAAHIDNNN